MATALTDTANQILRDVRTLVGAATPVIRSVRRRYSKLFASESSDHVLAVVRALLAEATFPARLIGYEVLAGHPDSMDRLDSALVEEFATGLADWASVDLFGVTIAGVAWRNDRLTDARLIRWARSKDRWRRRLALVATVPLNIKARGGTGDPRRTLMVCREVVADRDDMVVKALSWSLRELGKRDPECVADFLAREDARIASRVRREVRTKLETGLKNRRKAFLGGA
jgi:3-methyladenine DNA glycosylase AlkD